MTGCGEKFLPYGRQYLDEDDIEAVTNVLRGDWLTTGPMVQKFEHKLQDVVKSDYVVSCSSGTAALHMAYMALGVGAGDYVIVPSISFVATANGAAYCGADILFTDVDPASGLMRAKDVLDLIKDLSQDILDKVKVITAVNLTGEIAEIVEIHDIAKRYGWKMIIDSCHALGTSFHDKNGILRNVGDCHFADMEVFSFHPVKTIAMGEGGAVTTNDKALYDKLCLLRNHGIEREADRFILNCDVAKPQPWYYEMQILGYNYRQSDIHCALGVSQLEKLPKFIAKRQKLVTQYNSLLTGLSAHITPPKSGTECSAVRHLYAVLIDFKKLGIDRVDFVSKLSAKNVGTQVHYIPIYAHPFYEVKYGSIKRAGAEKYYAETLSLPLHVSMTEDDVVYVVDQISKIVKDRGEGDG